MYVHLIQAKTMEMNYFFNLSVSKFLSSKFIAGNFEEPLGSSLHPGN